MGTRVAGGPDRVAIPLCPRLKRYSRTWDFGDKIGKSLGQTGKVRKLVFLKDFIYGLASLIQLQYICYWSG